MNRIGALIPDAAWRRPEDVTEREIDPQSGMLATPYCPETRPEIFVTGTEPESVCPLHAGSGEPSPFWPETSLSHDEADRRIDPVQARRQAEEQRRRDRQRESAIRRLLRRIFGDN